MGDRRMTKRASGHDEEACTGEGPAQGSKVRGRHKEFTLIPLLLLLILRLFLRRAFLHYFQDFFSAYLTRNSADLQTA